MDTKSELEKLIINNNLESALTLVTDLQRNQTDKQFFNESILLQTKLQSLRKQERMGIISFTQSLREKTVITQSLLELIDKIDFEKQIAKTNYCLTIDASFNPENQERINEIVQNLIAVTNDYSIKVYKVISGSIKIYLEGTKDGFLKLVELFDEGNLSEILGEKIISLTNKLEINSRENLGKGPNKILFLASNPTNTGKIQLEKEFVRISSSLQEGDKGDSDYKLVAEWAITPGDLQIALIKHKPDIIHFSGHGMRNEFQNGGIILQDSEAKPKPVSGKALGNLFRLFSEKYKIKAVILNACYSEEQAISIGRHVQFVIGMRDTIFDNAAIEFSTGFYRGLASGEDIEFAFELAKNLIELEGLPDVDIPLIVKQL